MDESGSIYITETSELTIAGNVEMGKNSNIYAGAMIIGGNLTFTGKGSYIDVNSSGDLLIKGDITANENDTDDVWLIKVRDSKVTVYGNVETTGKGVSVSDGGTVIIRKGLTADKDNYAEIDGALFEKNDKNKYVREGSAYSSSLSTDVGSGPGPADPADPKGGDSILLIVAAVMVIIGAAFAAWLLFLRKKRT
jgi:hypothetical protein